MDELLEVFVAEGRELVQAATDDLMALERNPSDAGRLGGAFRAVHTLKGSAAVFDFAPMGAALHEAESLLDAVRGGRMAASPAVIDALLDCLRLTEHWVGTVERDGALPATAASEAAGMGAALRALADGAPAPAPAPDWPGALLLRQDAAVRAARAQGRALVALRYRPNADCFFLGDDPLASVRALPGLVALEIAPRVPWTEGFDPFTCNLEFHALSTATRADIAAVFRFVPDQVEIAAQPAPQPEPGDPSPPAEASRALRVDAARIDALADLVGELVVARNAMAELTRRAAAADPSLARALGAGQAELDRVAGALHRAVGGLRLTPLSRSFRRLPLLVRDIARQLGKTIAFEVSGDAVEADRTIVDGLFEPLLHVLRNAVHHGIETPELRRARGKPAAGQVRLQGRSEGDRIVVTVSDDGGGLDLARLRRAAAARGLLDEAGLNALDTRAASELAFAPGVSTADAVSAISGRGVGMDAVRAAVSALGGQVGIASTEGAGSVVRIVLPQAVLVTAVVGVHAGGQEFGIPVEVVAETMRVPATHILPAAGGHAFVLRGRTVPLLRLASLLGLDEPAARDGDARVLVVQAGAGLVGVQVERLGGRSEVLLRPPAGLVATSPGLLGTALLGDGRVLLVIDIAGLLA